MDAAAVHPGIDLGMTVCQQANQGEEIGGEVKIDSHGIGWW